MAVLALDLSLCCGWCLWRRGDKIESGHKDFERVSPQDEVRFLAFRQFLTTKRNGLIDVGETLDSVVYESVDFIPKKNGVNAAHVYGSMWGNLLSWCAFYGIKPRGLNVSVIKKHVTGYGSAAKPLVTKRVQELFPHVKQSDEADAVAVMLTAQDRFGHGGGK